MKGFEVRVNGEHLCFAGIGQDGVLTVSVSCSVNLDSPDDYHMHVGGLDAAMKEHVRWKVPNLSLGDEITVNLIEIEHPDPELKRFKPKFDYKRILDGRLQRQHRIRPSSTRKNSFKPWDHIRRRESPTP